MKCPQCGWIVRKDHGQPVPHPCNPPTPPRARRRRVSPEKYATRAEQRERYLDAGPQAWDDR